MRRALLVAAALALGSCKVQLTPEGLAKTWDAITDAQKELTPENEYWTGRSVATNLLARHEYRYHDADALQAGRLDGATAYVSAVGGVLAASAMETTRKGDRPAPIAGWHFTIVESDTINAFAAPGGWVFVTTAAIEAAQSEDELAAVLAHEIAHVTLAHATARTELELRSQLVSRVVADVLNDPTTGAQLQNQSRFALARFSREQELEADGVGVRTLARAGYDPYGAGRFLTSLNRTLALKTGTGAPGEPDMLATHPGTAERITLVTRAARRSGAPGIGVDDRARYLAAIDGLAYGDNPGEGAVRGRRFIHPSLGIAFEVPDGFAIENTRNAVLGTTPEGSRRLLFDQVDAESGQGLDAVLKATWNDAIEPGSVELREVGPYPAATALSRGKDWTFRLAALRVGEATYRMIMAAKGATDPDPAFRRWIASLAAVSSAETQALRPLRLQVVQASSTNPEDLARRMAVPDRALDRFLVLNGLERNAALRPGQGYKIVTE